MATAKKNAFMFHMPSIEQLENDVVTTYGLASNFSAVTKRDQRLEAELNTHVRGINGYTMKALVVDHNLTKLHNHLMDEAVTAADHHAEINKAQQGKEYQDFIKELSEYNLKLLGQQLTETTVIAKHILHGELYRHLDTSEPEVEIQYVYKEKEVPAKGLLERIFGA